MNLIKKALSYIQIYNERQLVNEYLKNEPRRIYHYHIRKTGGTSINFAFFHNSGFENLQLVLRSIRLSYTHRIFANGRIYVAFNRSLLNTGKYFYGYSHLPSHKLSIPKNVFAITCLRDPVKRFISHYNMLKYYQINNIQSLALKKEGRWLGKNILDFARSVPQLHLKNQIYMFSNKFDWQQALENLQKKVDFIMFTENLDNDLKALEQIIQLPLPSSRQRSYGYKEQIPQEHIDLLHEMLEDEYKFVNAAKQIKQNTDIQTIKQIAKEKFGL